MPKAPVDTALTIIVGPCTDDTDFKSLESVAYNAAGLDVSLYKSNPTGTPSKTALTPTTGGSQDWTELGDGYHAIEITAAQNDTEGVLFVAGLATGVLPFESQHWEIVPQNVYDSLMLGTDLLDVQVGGMDAGTVTAAAIATGAIDADAIAADAITAAKIADGAIDAATFAAGAINAAAIATDAINADALAADAVTEIQSGLATTSDVAVWERVGG